MQQLEIEFFYPLTEQTLLDLDFTPCIEYAASKPIGYIIGSSGNGLMVGTGGTINWSQPMLNQFVVKQDVKNVGKWEITENMFVYRPIKPNAIIRFMAKHLLGFKWHDEKK